MLVGLLVLSAWSAALASAHGELFTVNYSGAGTITSRIKSITSPQCGEVTEVRNETTHFSWVTHYELPVLIFGSHGLDGVPAKAEAHQSSLASNESTVKLSDTGCQPGIGNCTGESDPQPNHEAAFDIFTSGSCAINFNDAQLLLPEFGVPTQLTASFPVKVATLESLRVGHYFKVRISAGHYAPAHRHRCFASSGCLKDDFSWHGVVEFKRTG